MKYRDLIRADEHLFEGRLHGSIRAGDGWAAYVPDLPTVLVSADSRAETEELPREAVALYVDLLREKDTPLPPAAFRPSRSG